MTLLDDLNPLLEFSQGLDLADPDACHAALMEEFPADGEYILGIAEQLRAGLADGTLCHRGELPMKFSRLAKPSEESYGFSVDVVFMSGAGPQHCHPLGEIDLCIGISDEPTFDGNGPGWAVYGADSVHVPTVRNGEMIILYLLPNGAFELVQN